ncbi:MAG: hypothetical protein HZA80_03495 [Candidatus Taylorbacteria bacterium]|nr:hypothetical protein [Candidatus Taylorbacteria bacterium]
MRIIPLNRGDRVVIVYVVGLMVGLAVLCGKQNRELLVPLLVLTHIIAGFVAFMARWSSLHCFGYGKVSLPKSLCLGFIDAFLVVVLGRVP